MQCHLLKTTLQLAVNVEQVLDCLQMSRLACFMNPSEQARL